jgi:hypothetical protein
MQQCLISQQTGRILIETGLPDGSFLIQQPRQEIKMEILVLNNAFSLKNAF